MIFIGIDPGKTGGIAWVHDDSAVPCHIKFDGLTELDVHRVVQSLVCLAQKEMQSVYAVIESVSATPQMGVTSAFSFGRNFGFWLGVLAGCAVPYSLVRPQKWQKAMGCMSKGDKNVTKAAAQRLYPNERITHHTADALLLATFCRRHHAELF